MISNKFFNAHHAPIGAFSTFTFGMKGPSGGLGLELGGPANESLYIGVEERESPGQFRSLPFFPTDTEAGTSKQDYDVEGLANFQRTHTLSAFRDEEISRELGPSLDTWKAGDMVLRVASPVLSVPDPETAGDEELKRALAPSVIAELEIDNRLGTRSRKAFFGYAGSDRSSGMRVWRESGLVGVGQASRTAIVTNDTSAYGGVAWQPEAVLDPRHPSNLSFMLGSAGLLVVEVPPGEVTKVRFAICFYREGTATVGIVTRYLYRRWFSSIQDVAAFTLSHAEASLTEAAEFDARFSKGLSPERALMAAQAVRSYYGSTQCLEQEDGTPLWIVNEGEYRMMNTLDLTVDQAFFELAMNPWTVRNELDLHLRHYAYEDRVRFPGEEQTHAGGLAFTHDVGVANTFAEPGTSSYEQAGLHGCFSYMSCEELVNWVLCACLYLAHTGDWAWGKGKKPVLSAALGSLCNRDHPDPAQRNGVMGLDSARCEGGREITTYDSLDASLGQARNNIYLAVKTWAAYVLLESALNNLGEGNLAGVASSQARLCANTLEAAVGNDGSLPAVIGEGNDARIIPAIEGLIYPFAAQIQGVFSEFEGLVEVLRNHLKAVLRPGVCLFDDGGWKLSSTSRNSWLSKIYLCQFVAETILELPRSESADRAHLAWLMDEDNAYYAWSDQMLHGKAVGSRYYPRGVTSFLWVTSGPHSAPRPQSALYMRS